MLFMGEEAAVETPFLFFADWSGEAAELTREGRRKEFAHFKAFSTPEMRAQDSGSLRCRNFSGLEARLGRHRPLSRERQVPGADSQLLEIRREKIVPLIKERIVSAQRALLGGDATMGGVDVRWQTARGDTLQIVVNFTDHCLPMPQLTAGECVWRAGPLDVEELLPGDIIVRLGSA